MTDTAALDALREALEGLPAAGIDGDEAHWAESILAGPFGDLIRGDEPGGEWLCAGCKRLVTFEHQCPRHQPQERDGVGLIDDERDRQLLSRQDGGEGYDAAHDAGHAEELAQAAASYALAPNSRHAPPPDWPWALVYWKPTPSDRIRELVKAGALIAAAIDSLLARPEVPTP